MPKISAVIITLNEEHNIEECLRSIAWADEIVVVDGNSTDRTVEICRQYTDKVFTNPFTDFSTQKQVALDRCQCPWVLSIDADERVRPELQTEIQQLLAGELQHDGYYIARRSYFLNKWIRYGGWYPGYQLRLFRREKTRLSSSRVHEGYLVEGTCGTLKHDLDHYSHPSIEDSIKKLNHYTTLEARDRLGRKKVHVYHFILNPTSAFLKKYIRQQGFRDGMHGFLLSWITAFLKMVLYMKIWVLQTYGGPQVRIQIGDDK